MGIEIIKEVHMGKKLYNILETCAGIGNMFIRFLCYLFFGGIISITLFYLAGYILTYYYPSVCDPYNSFSCRVWFGILSIFGVFIAICVVSMIIFEFIKIFKNSKKENNK
jgi:uncharacterized membrane protein YhdT